MDKIVAKKIADEKIQELLSGDRMKIISLLTESENELITKDGVEYQIKTEAFYDDKKEKVIRVCASVDDQRFLSTLVPVSRSKLIKIAKNVV